MQQRSSNRKVIKINSYCKRRCQNHRMKNKQKTSEKIRKKHQDQNLEMVKAHTIRCEYYGLITRNRKEKTPPNIMPQGARKRI